MTEAHPDPHDLREVIRVARAEGAGWVSLDGYAFDPTYHERIVRAGFPLLVFDDNAHLDRYAVDVLLNQNIHAGALRYRTRPDTKRLLGTKYVVLRTEFLNQVREPAEGPDVAERLLVTLGGSDRRNTTGRVLGELDHVDVDGLEISVVIGPDNRRSSLLQKAAEQAWHPTRVVRNVENMARLIANADLAISAGGTTLWELAYFGIPTIAIVLAENQRIAVEALESKGMLLNLGEPESIRAGAVSRAVRTLARNPEARRTMARIGRMLVDGGGSKRVLKTLAGHRVER